jgi:hypothetical protein
MAAREDEQRFYGSASEVSTRAFLHDYPITASGGRPCDEAQTLCARLATKTVVRL